MVTADRSLNLHRFSGNQYLAMDTESSIYHFASLYSPMFNMQTSAALCLQFNFYLKPSTDGQPPFSHLRSSPFSVGVSTKFEPKAHFEGEMSVAVLTMN